MGLPEINYNAGAGDIPLPFKRGPQGFKCAARAVVHDNDATSGVRERVIERTQLVLTFTMPALRVDDDLPAWSTFMQWALQGGSFYFMPNSDLGDYYRAISEDQEFAPERKAPGVYAAAFQWRILTDELTPASPGVVLKRFYGIAG